MEPFNIAGARENLKKRRAEIMAEREKLFYKASDDCKLIIKMIISRFNPVRIYQWGSLLDKKMFTDYSDIDIALEGIGSIEDIIELEKIAESMTEFPLDIVELGKINPIHADSIRTKGIIVYERI